MKKKSSVKHSYTLIELLVVVAIASILFGIGLPAFNVLTKGNAMTSSINELAGKIKATRAYAVSNNCYTAIIIPAFGDGNNLGALNQELLNRSYRPCVVYPRDNESSWVFDSWIDGENWKMLGNGIIFSKEAKRDGSSNNLAFVYQKTRLATVADWNTDSSIVTASDNYLAIKDGSTALYPVSVPQDFLAEHGTGDVTFYRVMIFRPNGQLVQNTFFTLQEGANTGTDVIATQEEGKEVYYALGVNKFNGKITYYEPVSK